MKGDKALKYVHDDFYVKLNKKTNKDADICSGKKKDGSSCYFKAIKDSAYCKVHGKQKKKKCQGKKNDGSKCNFKCHGTSSYCKKHQPTQKINCAGTYLSGKLKGTHCQHFAIDNSKYCKYHTV
jgi:hypothetical protein